MQGGANWWVFLRIANSELGKNDTKQIRSWCSWEFGNFYGPNLKGASSRVDEKYYIQVYANFEKKGKKKQPHAPSIIDGLKQLSSVKDGRLVGYRKNSSNLKSM